MRTVTWGCIRNGSWSKGRQLLLLLLTFKRGSDDEGTPKAQPSVRSRLQIVVNSNGTGIYFAPK